MPTLSFPIVAVAALLDSINPCAISVLLLTIAFLFSLGKNRKAILKIGAAYIAAIFVVYLLVGVGVLQVLSIFNIPHFIAKLGAAILIALGLIEVLGELIPNFPIQFGLSKSVHPKLARFIQQGSVPAAFVLGALIALHEFPCTGGPYLVILGLLHDTGTYLSGFGWLVLYNFIFVLPLIATLFIASRETLYRKFEAWKKGNMRRASLAVGFGMMLLGFIIFLF